MLIGLQIRDVVLIESLDLSIGPGLTALTGETGAGKSIILDALGLATGMRGDAGLVRRGAAQAMASAAFAPALDHPVWTLLEDKGLAYARDEDLVLRRTLSADGRSRAFVNDQATGVGVLKELGEALLEVHGQHETVGLLDARTHRPMLDAYGALAAESEAVAAAWRGWRAARERVEALREDVARSAAETEERRTNAARRANAGREAAKGLRQQADRLHGSLTALGAADVDDRGTGSLPAAWRTTLDGLPVLGTAVDVSHRIRPIDGLLRGYLGRLVVLRDDTSAREAHRRLSGALGARAGGAAAPAATAGVAR